MNFFAPGDISLQFGMLAVSPETQCISTGLMGQRAKTDISDTVPERNVRTKISRQVKLKMLSVL